MKHAPLIAGALFSIAVFLAGCTAPAKSADTNAPAKAAKDETYVQVNSMGSWIPRKVKKKADLIGDSGQVVDPAALNKIRDQGSTHVVTEAQAGGAR